MCDVEKFIEEEKAKNSHPYCRDEKYRKKLKRLAKAKENSWFSPAWCVKSDEHKPEYVKREYRGKRSKILKKISNKKVRQFQGEIPDGCGYKRIFDLWWELY